MLVSHRVDIIHVHFNFVGTGTTGLDDHGMAARRKVKLLESFTTMLLNYIAEISLIIISSTFAVSAYGAFGMQIYLVCEFILHHWSNRNGLNNSITKDILEINKNATLVFSISFQHGLVPLNFVFIRQLYFTYSIKRPFFILIDCQYALFKRACSKTSYLTLCNVPHE